METLAVHYGLLRIVLRVFKGRLRDTTGVYIRGHIEQVLTCSNMVMLLDVPSEKITDIFVGHKYHTCYAPRQFLDSSIVLL